MKLILEHTEHFFRTDEGIPVRVWKGETGKGSRVVAFIAAVTPMDPAAADELDAELREIPGPNIARVVERP